MEIKIPKEVRQHKESIFFGLSTRQFFCALFAVGIAVAVYLLLGNAAGKETASWVCILAAAPVAVAGFFSYNGLTLEQFLWALLRNTEGQKQYNLVHLNAMFDLMSKVYVDIALQGKKGMNEHKALVSMVDRSAVSGKVIALMDRGYESFNNIAHFQEKGWNFVIRAKESYGIISNLPLPNTDEFDANITLTLARARTHSSRVA